MTDLEDRRARVDGRVARRERNINSVLDVVLEMFAEESLFPTIEQASKRSGLSLRSLYRYFADPGELIDAAIQRNREMSVAAAHIPTIGQGPLDERIENLVASRLRLHDANAPVFRATVVNAATHVHVREELGRGRADLRSQLELQFAPELRSRRARAREAMLSAADVLTQIDSIDYLRRNRQMSVAETNDVLVAALAALFTG